MSIPARISVVIPAYNAGPFIGETLDSVRRQTRAPHEVIVVDDGSSDETVNVARKAGTKVVRCASNRGVSAARNDGLRFSSGDYVALLDADDLWASNHLDLVGGLLDAHPRAVLAYSRAQKFGDETGPTRKTIPPGVVRDAFDVAARVNLSLTCCAVFRREVALDLGGFDTDIRYGEDFAFWLRVTAQHPVVCTDEITARYRIHTTGKGDTRAAAREGQCRARRRMWESLDADRDAARRERLERTMMECWEGHVRSAWQDGDWTMFDRMLALSGLVPRSESTHVRWELKRPFFPARMLWNRQPDAVRRTVKRLLGRAGCDA